jgi:hypothetical protein
LAHFPLGYYYRFACPYIIEVASFVFWGDPVNHNNLHWLTHRLDTCKYSGLDITTTIYQPLDIPNNYKSSTTSTKLTTKIYDPSPKMPIFRTLTTKLKTSLSPSSSPDSSPDQSPTSLQVSSFEKGNGRKEAGVTGAVKRPEVQARVDSYMTQASNASNESVEEKKQRRMSRFREELDFEAEE